MLGETLEENEATEKALAKKTNADSATSNKEELISDAQLGNKVEIAVEVANEKDKETNDNTKGGEKALTVDNDGGNTTISDTNGDHMVKLYQNTSEDEDDEEADLWEDHDDDSEEDDEETAIDEDEVSEEDETEGEDDEEDSEGDDEEIATDKNKVTKKEATEEENAKEERETANGDERVAEEHNVEKVEVNLKVNKPRGKREKNKVREEGSKKLDTTDKPNSSIERKGKKRVESMGMIFMCSSNTKNDCFKYMVLGKAKSKKNEVEKIYPGMRLFLYDVDLKLMYGIFKARERGGYNVEPKAFKSKFPSQVRFTVLADCVPLAEEKFKKVIKENYFTNKKFDCQLNAEQVKKLCKLFKSTSKGHQPIKLRRSRKAEKRPIPIHGESSRKRRADDKRQPIPIRGEGARKQRADDKRRPERQEKIRYVERPRKRPRKSISPVARSRQILPPSSVPLIALDRNLDVDPYRRAPYLENRDPYHDPYESRRDRPIERRDPYESRRDQSIERRDPYLERSRGPYREERDPYLERSRDTYREVRDPHLDIRTSYTETRELYPDHRIRYRDGLDSYPDTRDPYGDDRGAYIERRVYADEPYRRDPLPEGRDVYGEDRGGRVVYRDSYRTQAVLDPPLSLESRRRYDVVSQDPYVSYRALPSNPEPLYISQYPSRSYRL